MNLFGEVVITMLVIMDPPGNTPIFLSVTKNLTEKERHRAAYLAVGTAFFVISLFAIGGQSILNYLNVSVPAMEGAGGLLLLLVALQLLYGKGQEDAFEVATPEQRTSIAMVPLGTPLLAGPGAIVATMIYVQKADTNTQILGLAIAILAVHIIIGTVLMASTKIVGLIKNSGVTLLASIAGLLLAAIAVQMLANAIKTFAAA